MFKKLKYWILKKSIENALCHPLINGKPVCFVNLILTDGPKKSISKIKGYMVSFYESRNELEKDTSIDIRHHDYKEFEIILYLSSGYWLTCHPAYRYLFEKSLDKIKIFLIGFRQKIYNQKCLLNKNREELLQHLIDKKMATGPDTFNVYDLFKSLYGEMAWGHPQFHDQKLIKNLTFILDSLVNKGALQKTETLVYKILPESINLLDELVDKRDRHQELLSTSIKMNSLTCWIMFFSAILCVLTLLQIEHWPPPIYTYYFSKNSLERNSG